MYANQIIRLITVLATFRGEKRGHNLHITSTSAWKCAGIHQNSSKDQASYQAYLKIDWGLRTSGTADDYQLWPSSATGPVRRDEEAIKYVAGVQKFPQARYKNLIGTDCWSPKVINRRWPCAWQFFTISDVGANCCQNKSSATDRCIWWHAPRTRYVEVYTFTMNILVRWWPVAGIGLTRESLGAYERLDSTCDRSIKALKEWSMTLPRLSCCTPELFLSNFNRWRDQARGRCPEDKHSRHHKLTYSSI